MDKINTADGAFEEMQELDHRRRIDKYLDWAADYNRKKGVTEEEFMKWLEGVR